MAVFRLFVVFTVFCVALQEVYSYGKMTDPVSRSIVWRLHTNREENDNSCGGFEIQYKQNGGKCGPCGDNYQDEVPRQNENGGHFGKGHIVKKYEEGKMIQTSVELLPNQKGDFKFSICVLDNPSLPETEECFEQNPLKVANMAGQLADRYDLGNQSGVVNVTVILPKGLKCEWCVLRWNYRAGNRRGICKDGTRDIGCGDQDTYRSCADIAIE